MGVSNGRGLLNDMRFLVRVPSAWWGTRTDLDDNLKVAENLG